MIVLDTAGRADGKSEKVLRMLTHARKTHGTAFGRVGLGLKAMIGQALAAAEVSLRADYRQRARVCPPLLPTRVVAPLAAQANAGPRGPVCAMRASSATAAHTIAGPAGPVGAMRATAASPAA